MISICAVIAARNEAPYLSQLLPMLASQGIDAAILDNESTDDSEAVYRTHMGKPIVRLERLPFPGHFSLTEQLQAKQRLLGTLEHDWIIHHDADEIFEHREAGATLREAIEEADAAGYTALNFDEFVFLPEPNTDYAGRNYYEDMLRYYFFEPRANRKNAVWKRSANLSNVGSGGHTLSGTDLRIWPQNHVYRHYIVLSYEHALQKYLHRSFDPQDLQLGWHGNRLNFSETNLQLPADSPHLFQLDSHDSKQFHREAPTRKHYWEWG